VIWLGFEAGIAPLLKIEQVKKRPVLWRTAVALDHVLYGVVVAGRLAPEPADRPRTARVTAWPRGTRPA